VVYGNVGEVLLAQGELDEALKAYRDSLAIRERLVAATATTPSGSRDLAYGHTSLFTVYQQQGDTAQALAELRAARAIMAALVALAPNLASWSEFLAWIDQQIARLEGPPP